MVMNFGILIVSDSCYKKEKTDQSGVELLRLVEEHIPHQSVLANCVPDEKEMIKEKLLEWTDTAQFDVILTTGGTGIAPRDVTPEATREVIEKELPGVMHAIMSESLKKTPYAMLSRAVVGVRNKTLIINMPGSVKAVKENFHVFKDILKHAVSLLNDDLIDVHSVHNDMHKKNAQGKESNSIPSKVKPVPSAKRNRKSPHAMISMGKALDIITSVCVQTADIEVVDWKKCHGRVLAADLFSNEPLPPFRAAIKDGYGFKYDDRQHNLKIQRVSKAGDQLHDNILEDGYCVRISTGAPVPNGADAVVPIEDTKISVFSKDGLEELEIQITGTGDYRKEIREIGSDIAKHVAILKKGIVLNHAAVGIVATIGQTEVKVFKQPITGVISTGNELQLPGAVLQSGCIRDSNKITLLCLLSQYGYPGKDYGIAKDDPNDVKWKLEKAFSECDYIITSGGASMGEYDIIEHVLIQDFDATIHFGSVNMKPGKPTKFASCVYDGKVKYIFVLPGNPVSATVTWLLFVLPALRHFENQTNFTLPMVAVNPDFDIKSDALRPELQRVQVNYGSSNIRVSTTGNQISSRLNSCVNANGLLIVPPKGSKYSDLGLKEHTEETQYWCYLLDKF